jgi:hypothetical protein
LYSIATGKRNSAIISAAGLLMGLLVLISAHSFIGIGEYALFLCIFQFPWRKPREWVRQIKFWAHFGGFALLFGIPQIIWLLRVRRIGFMTISPIWRETFPNSFKFCQLWWDSLGSFIVLALCIGWNSLNRKQISAYLPAIAVFVLSNFIRYQPGAMDNNKVFYAAWYPLACCVVAHFFIWISIHGNLIAICLASSVVFGFSVSSVVAIWKALAFTFPLFTHEEKDFGEWVMLHTLKDSIFLGSMWHSNPAMSVGGRLITMGYGGWIWTHGLNSTARRILINELINDKENVTRFNELKIRYIISHNQDHKDGFHFEIPPPTSQWIPIVEFSTARIYRLLQG